jgi:hypothetical protein
MAKKPTQAERFWQAERARKVARPTPAGTVFDVHEPFPAARLMQPGAECCVDPAIREALDAGLLNGPFEAIREDLAVVCATAWGAAGAVYAAQLAAPELRDRQAKAARLAEDLRRFLASVEDEADGAADLSAMLNHGGALIGLLQAYSEPDAAAQSAPAADHLQREFFAALGVWWADHAIDPDRRGAKAIRNRLAVGLWFDMGQEIPSGYYDDDFARRGFSLGKIER